MDVLVDIGVVLATGLALAVGWWVHRRQMQVSDKERLAQSRGGQFVGPSCGLLSYKGHRIEVEVGDVLVRCDTCEVDPSRGGTHTRIRGCFPLPAGPVFSVSRSAAPQRLAAFDEMFLVTSDDPLRMRQLWTPAAGADLFGLQALQAVPGASYSVSGNSSAR